MPRLAVLKRIHPYQHAVGCQKLLPYRIGEGFVKDDGQRGNSCGLKLLKMRLKRLFCGVAVRLTSASPRQTMLLSAVDFAMTC